MARWTPTVQERSVLSYMQLTRHARTAVFPVIVSALLVFWQISVDIARATTVNWADRSTTWSPVTAGHFPCTGDLDGDGDMDLVVFDPAAAFENTGPGSHPSWSVREDWGGAIAVPDGYVYGADMGDLDGDGDNDLLIAIHDVGIMYLENAGTPAVPTWVRNDDYFFLPGSFLVPAPSIVDLDRDGDADITVGSWHSLGCIWNEGSGAVPVWVEDWSAFDTIHPYGQFIDLCFGDLDSDGDLDLVTAPLLATGRLQAYENFGGTGSPSWSFELGLIGAIPQFDDMMGASLVDLNADGRPDFLTLRAFETSCFANEGPDTSAVERRSWGSIKSGFR